MAKEQFLGRHVGPRPEDVEEMLKVIGVKSVVKDDELMLITTEGIIIRIRVNDTALLGRVTSGVKLIDLKSGVTVEALQES